MGAKRSATRGLACALLGACCLTLLLGSAAGRAALSTPDAMCYGRVSVNGEAAPGSIVSARLGDIVLGAAVVGANASAPTFYGLAIPMAQTTETGETLPPGTAADGNLVRLFVNDRFAAEVEVRTGAVARRDLSGGATLCTGGSQDGQACTFDDDCPGGFCTIARALCDGGGNDGQACQCIGGSCSTAASCPQNAARGTCQGGDLDGECCDVAMNCPGGACAGSQKLCQGGTQKGQPCVRNSHCPGSSCVSPTLLCLGGSQAGYSCIDGDQCPGGQCGQRLPTATPSATPTRSGTVGRTRTPTPTATPGPGGCAGDCDGDATVSIAELIRMVNIALGLAPASQCPAGDRDADGTITISELIAAVGRALSSCDS